MDQLNIKVRQLHKKGMTTREIVEVLNSEGFKNSKGGKLTKSNVNYVLYKKPTKTVKIRESFNSIWVRKILTEPSLRDDEKVRQLKAFLG